MNKVNTIAPISIEDLKLYFTDKSTFYVINYAESKLKGAKLLTYLSNLDIPADIDFSTSSVDEKYDMLKAYMETSSIVNILSLEFLTMQTIEEAKGLFNHGLKDFIESNSSLIASWISKIDSLTIYNMYTINSDETRDFATSFDHVSGDDMVGLNFVSLLKHQELYTLYEKIDQSTLKFYDKYFTEYVFKGRNLYSYWANANNPLFLLTQAIGNNEIDLNEYNAAKLETIKGIENVSPI